MTPDTITAIASVLAGAASFGLALALRALARERRHANAYRQAARDSHTVAERWRAEAMSLRKPARDGSLGSLGRALRKTTTPAAPSRSFPTARGTRISDPVIDTATGTTFSMWAASSESGSSSSCDTSSSSDSGSSSSSSDGGSCGGGE